TVGWDDQNIGDAAISGSFNDYVLVQRVNPDSSLTDITSGYVRGDGTLAAGGATSPQTFTFTLPDRAARVGALQISLTTDAGQSVREYDSSGSPAYGNNTGSTSFASTLANYADLTVLNLSVQSPVAPQSGNQVTVAWDDENAGNDAVSTSFSDSVLVQRVNPD